MHLVFFPALLLSAVALYACWTALMTECPTPAVPLLSRAIWWLGWALAWTCVLLLAGGIAGLGARAMWRMVG